MAGQQKNKGGTPLGFFVEPCRYITNSICIRYTNYKKGGNLLYCGTCEATERIGWNGARAKLSEVIMLSNEVRELALGRSDRVAV